MRKVRLNMGAVNWNDSQAIFNALRNAARVQRWTGADIHRRRAS
jgi:hypothetical protein